uniref:Uncharacterized protein n=1 Tax=Rhizophora mucronata TaxID=61149 RepID=A0A2P2NA59_RHIMU
MVDCVGLSPLLSWSLCQKWLA